MPLSLRSVTSFDKQQRLPSRNIEGVSLVQILCQTTSLKLPTPKAKQWYLYAYPGLPASARAGMLRLLLDSVSGGSDTVIFLNRSNAEMYSGVKV